MVDRPADRLHSLATDAHVEPANGSANVSGGWIATFSHRLVRRHRPKHHLCLNHCQDASRLIGPSRGQPLLRIHQLLRRRRSGWCRRERGP